MSGKISTAVILAGGPGIRLKPLTDRTPKALVEIAEKPLIEWVIEWCVKNNVSRIVLGVAHLKEKIIEYLGDGSRLGVNITYSVHTLEGGTGEGFRLAISRYVDDDSFFALNGDQITDLSLKDMAEFHLNHGLTATIAMTNPHCPYGHIRTDEDNIVEFMEKPFCPYANCSTGVYAFKREILDLLPQRGDVEKTTFPLLAAKNRLKAYPFKVIFITVNTPKDLVEAEERLRATRW
ncbi:MAG: NDP-sugar synthase [Candidatus Bathyarchaeia archaeon]